VNFQIICGDALTVLRTLPSESVHCCVTSPPYWGLRDYGSDPIVWGGDSGHEHDWQDTSWKPDRWGVHDDDNPGEKQQTNGGSLGHRGAVKEQATCACGAWRGSLGLEPTPELFVEHIVSVFAEVRRVLRSDGTLWVNLGDSYAANAKGSGGKKNSTLNAKRDEDGTVCGKSIVTFALHSFDLPASGLKPKDLVGIPWRVAFALQADGWWLRSDIIWHKPNPMPESVTDRPTKSHEYLFLLAKSERYWYDAEAIKEPASVDTHARYARGRSDTHKWADGGPGNQTIAKGFEHMRAPGVNPKAAMNAPGSKQNASFSNAVKDIVDTRNKRSVWTLATLPTPDAHFATFPIELPETCIKAGCPPEGKRCDCDEIIETPLGTGPISDPSLETGRAGMNRPRRPDEGTRPITRREQREYAGQMRDSPHRAQMRGLAGEAFAHYTRTDQSGARPLPAALLGDWLALGWLTPATPCQCPIEPAGTVLDPFAGAGTTGLAALKQGRKFLGIELNPKYIEIANARAQRHYPLLISNAETGSAA
jgi:DNA modification methylase